MQRLEVSGVVRPIYGSLGVKRLKQVSVKWGVKVRCERNWFGIVPPNTLRYQQVLYQLRDCAFHRRSTSNYTSH